MNNSQKIKFPKKNSKSLNYEFCNSLSDLSLINWADTHSLGNFRLKNRKWKILGIHPKSMEFSMNFELPLLITRKQFEKFMKTRISWVATPNHKIISENIHRPHPRPDLTCFRNVNSQSPSFKMRRFVPFQPDLLKFCQSKNWDFSKRATKNKSFCKNEKKISQICNSILIGQKWVRGYPPGMPWWGAWRLKFS